jgi:hypothetical protein
MQAHSNILLSAAASSIPRGLFVPPPPLDAVVISGGGGSWRKYRSQMRSLKLRAFEPPTKVK